MARKMKKNESKSAITKRRNKNADRKFQNLKFQTISVMGVELHVVEKRSCYYIIGDFPKHIEKHIDAALAQLLNTKAVVDDVTLDHDADLEMAAAIIQGA